MFVRDHNRPEMHDAMGLNATEYDYAVFRITSEISKQAFPFTLDIDHPVFRAGMDRLCVLSAAMDAAKARGGLIGKVQQAVCAVKGFATFVRLYLLPTCEHELPKTIHMAPAW
jgi:magnesium-protoporphyrin IX monomethyl ester (oxidative) cyclase